MSDTKKTIPLSALRREAERSGATVERDRVWDDPTKYWLWLSLPGQPLRGFRDTTDNRRFLLGGLRALPTKKRSATKRKARRGK